MNISRMASLGSSFASGPGIRPTAHRGAMRSERNYAHLTAAALGASLIDASVSGATTETILATPQRMGLRRFPPQIDSIDSADDLDLVTITAGGNDLGYLGAVTGAAYATWLARRAITRPLARRLRAAPDTPVTQERIEAAAAGLTRIVREVARRAPRARILLVDYLTIIGPETQASRSVPFTAEEMARFRDIGVKLANAFEIAASETVAELVPMSRLSTEHAVDAAEPWVTGFAPGIRARNLAPFHPNAAGMRAASSAILEHLRG